MKKKERINTNTNARTNPGILNAFAMLLTGPLALLTYNNQKSEAHVRGRLVVAERAAEDIALGRALVHPILETVDMEFVPTP